LIAVLLLFRKAVFDIALEKSVFISGLDTLKEAVASFIHLCFTANIEYPKVTISADLCMRFLAQRIHTYI
jgi:hypothetical protein